MEADKGELVGLITAFFVRLIVASTTAILLIF